MPRVWCNRGGQLAVPRGTARRSTARQCLFLSRLARSRRTALARASSRISTPLTRLTRRPHCIKAEAIGAPQRTLFIAGLCAGDATGDPP